MKTIKTLLVDDEYLALNLLENYIGRLPDMEVTGKVKSAIEALEVLHREPVDLLFLDIQMPTLSGNNMLKTLKTPPVTIFTTAYADFALEAFDLNAADYLLKPFSFERFLQAVNKARLLLPGQPPAPPKPDSTTPAPAFYSAKADGKVIKIFYSDILYIEGWKEYVRFVTPTRKYTVYESLKNLQTHLPQNQFLRVHKSYIVAIDKVTALQGNLLEIEQQRIPISRRKREEVQKIIFGEF